MMNLELLESLPTLVLRAFAKARDSGGLTFSPTDLAIIQTSRNIPVLCCFRHFTVMRLENFC